MNPRNFFGNLLRKLAGLIPNAGEATPPQAEAKPKFGNTLQGQIQQGLENYGNPPIATLSAQLAQSGKQMPQTVDKFLPTVMSIMETGGGKKQRALNNPVNLRGIQDGNTQFINYPSPDVALLGGDNNGVPAQGFTGTILRHSAYDQFRNTGDLRDFFSHYTPPGDEYDNPTMEELLTRYKNIRSRFGGQ